MKAEELLRIGELFASLDWPTDDHPDTPFSPLFSRFCRMWNRLDTSHRELIILLTKSYIWITPDKIGNRFLSAWRKMAADLAADTEVVTVVPVPKPAGVGPKSYDFVHYLARTYELNLRQSIGHRELRIVSTTDEYVSVVRQKKAALVLVDDYIGSGDTVVEALREVRAQYPNDKPNQSFVVAIAAQSDAAARLRTKGCTLVADMFLTRGISDNTDLPDVSEARRLMQHLEQQLQVSRSLRFGFGGAEGLITLLRTPDNTFPVYWTNNKVNGVVWDAPFPR